MHLKYQRTVIGYHGCDQSVARDVLMFGKELKPSENDYDWLGRGVYFWEHGPRRAYEWAQQSLKVERPSVIGAYINLGYCFDLLDTEYTGILTEMFPIYQNACEKVGRPIPVSLPAMHETAGDLLLRYLDCAVINWSLNLLQQEQKQHFHTVRCLFSEGAPVFAGSKILAKSHLQIAVRDQAAIIGYFKPQG